MKSKVSQQSAEETGDAVALPVNQAFVVQFSIATEPSRNRYAGRVEHVLSGRAARFQSAEEAVAFVVRMLGEVASQRGPT